MRAKLYVSFLTALLATVVVGWTPSERGCSGYPLCLTSFIWCDARGAGCHFPDGVYPRVVNPKQAPYALVAADRNYTISWKLEASRRDIPVHVEWALSQNISWEMSKHWHIRHPMNDLV